MRITLHAILGLLAGVTYVAFSGLLEIQAIGMKQGAVFDIFNHVVSVRPPAFPFLQYTSNAVLGTAVFCLLFIWRRDRKRRDRLALQLGFSISSLALIIIVGSTFWAKLRETDLPPIRTGLEGWIQVGSSVTAVHLLVVLAVFKIIWSMISRNPDLNLRVEEDQILIAEPELP